MQEGAPTPAGDLDALLDSLDTLDVALRTLYRQLADDPDLADERATTLAELRRRRLELAQKVGLELLAQRRASATALEAAPPARGEPAEVDSAPSMESQPERASDEDIAQWKSAARARGGLGRVSDSSTTTTWAHILDGLMQTIGAPRKIDSGFASQDEVEALEAASRSEKEEVWSELPKHVARLWLSMLVARGRALKELPAAALETKQRAKALMSHYPAWAKQHTPGHVNGLQIRHVPLHGSWVDDGVRYWRELDAMLGEGLGSRPPASRRPRDRAIPHGENVEGTLDPTWPLLPTVRGQRAILVGGDPREPNRVRLERALQLASLEWSPVDGPRRVEAVLGRIGGGSYDLVIVLQPFVAHAESEPIIAAAKRARVPWAIAEGYGLGAVKLALERFLGAAAAQEAR